MQRTKRPATRREMQNIPLFLLPVAPQFPSTRLLSQTRVCRCRQVLGLPAGAWFNLHREASPVRDAVEGPSAIAQDYVIASFHHLTGESLPNAARAKEYKFAG